MQSTPHSPLPVAPPVGNGADRHGQGLEAGRGDYGDYLNRGGAAQDHREAPVAPTSPNLTTAFHHGPAETETSMPTLRRLNTEQLRDMLRVTIATPFSENARRKERMVSASLTVRQLKDDIAQDREETYDRNGMRLVWQGRIVRDEEVLGVVIGKRDPDQVHTFHLVARRIGGTAPTPVSSRPAHAATVTAADVASPSTLVPQVLPPPSRNSQAMDDSVHFTLFMIRHHLCHLLDAPPLEWDAMVPPPVVDRKTAREAVISVIRPFAAQQEDRDEAWDEWAKAFEEDDAVDWREKRRTDIEKEVMSLWSSRVGRAWRETPSGEQAQVELDSYPYTLHLPPLSHMAPSQLTHLVLYLRLAALLPLLNELQRSAALSSLVIAPTPTVLTTAAPVRTRQFGFRLRLNPTTLTHLFFSAVKACAMIWMLTRSMRWDDFRFWIVGGGLMGWWIGDAANQLRPGLIWNGGQAAQPGQAGAEGVEALNGGNGGVAAEGLNGPAPAAPFGNTARVRSSTAHVVTRLVPLVHIDTDSEQLHLALHRPRYQPWRVVTQLLLPIALWFITLIPEWETVRAQAIRRRERAMRVWVGELTVARNNAEAEARSTRAETERADSGESSTVPTTDGAERPPVLPEGLSGPAKRYYERIIGRGEGIDWEEEREAQRAMGIAEDEDRQDDDGMRMRML